MGDIRERRWQDLREHAEQLSAQHLSGLFAEDPQRFERFHRRHEGLLLDFSKQRLDEAALNRLVALADALDLRGWVDRLFAGEIVNFSEQRAAMHWRLRSFSPGSSRASCHSVQAELDGMAAIVSKLHAGQWRGVTGEVITDVVNIGVGGSDLGPLMACRALEDDAVADGRSIALHFVSTMDGSQVSHLLRSLRPQTTLFIISSKSFSTLDTLSNAGTARSWLERHFGDSPALMACHFIGVSANKPAMDAWGISPTNQLRLWDWVGGRYSVWSAIGLPVALRIGMPGFLSFLRGAESMDRHFREAEWLQNLPVLLGLIGIWNHNILEIGTHAVLPYDGRLKYFPAYLSQLEMESNGKCVTREGEPVDENTCPVIWGDVGPNAQHAFYQLLHQGTRAVSSEFIAPIRRYHNETHSEAAGELARQHELALANCLAQSRLLALGRAPEIGEDDIYRRYHGNQPSTTLLLDELSPFTLGSLIALYEHKVFVQSVVWQINPFDQWGVEEGKRLATSVHAVLAGEQASDELDASTAGLVGAIRTRGNFRR